MRTLIHPSPCLLAIHVLMFSHLISALVTLGTMRNLTEVTDECRERIVGSDNEGGVGMVSGMVGVGQVVFGGASERSSAGGDDGGEVEDTITAALRILCSDLLIHLEKSLESSSSEAAAAFPTRDSLFCRLTIREYHHFLSATVKFLHEIQERQMLWHWSAQSGVFDALTWLQGLWASRKANSQNRSFIEQQMMFYADTGCFGKDQEVLRRDMEVVEYMNDLIDSFQ